MCEASIYAGCVFWSTRKGTVDCFHARKVICHTATFCNTDRFRGLNTQVIPCGVATKRVRSTNTGLTKSNNASWCGRRRTAIDSGSTTTAIDTIRTGFFHADRVPRSVAAEWVERTDTIFTGCIVATRIRTTNATVLRNRWGGAGVCFSRAIQTEARVEVIGGQRIKTRIVHKARNQCFGQQCSRGFCVGITLIDTRTIETRYHTVECVDARCCFAASFAVTLGVALQIGFAYTDAIPGRVATKRIQRTHTGFTRRIGTARFGTTDTTILCGNGAVIKTHGSFVYAESADASVKLLLCCGVQATVVDKAHH